MRFQLLACILAAGTLTVVAYNGPQDPPQQEKQQAREPASPEVGKPAPAFRLNDHDGRAVALGKDSGADGWTAVAFFPKAATPG